MTYQLTNSDAILRLEDNVFIPKAPGNRDYREYLDWLSEGNTPLPAPPAPPPAPPPPPPGPTIEELVAEIDALKAQLSITTARVDAVEDAILPTWQQPSNTETAYPLGAVVLHDNAERPDVQVWESLIAANTTEPGADGIPPDGPWYDRYWRAVR